MTKGGNEMKCNQDGGEWKDQATILVDELIEKGFALLKDKNSMTVPEMVRLLELREELAEDQPKEVTVRWVDPTEDD